MLAQINTCFHFLEGCFLVYHMEILCMKCVTFDSQMHHREKFGKNLSISHISCALEPKFGEVENVIIPYTEIRVHVHSQ